LYSPSWSPMCFSLLYKAGNMICNNYGNVADDHYSLLLSLERDKEKRIALSNVHSQITVWKKSETTGE